jgi:hypothetical protein
MTTDREQDPTPEQQPTLEPWSPTGTAYSYKGGKFEYQHITIGKVTNLIATCGGCGRAAYIRTERRYTRPSTGGETETTFCTNGLKLLEVGFSANGTQRSIELLCPECIAELRRLLGEALYQLSYEEEAERQQQAARQAQSQDEYDAAHGLDFSGQPDPASPKENER